MQELVIMDIDNTLIKGQSQHILLNYLYRRRIIGVCYFVRIYFWFILYKLGLVKNPKNILGYAVRFLRVKKVSDVEHLIKEFMDTVLRGFFFTEALEIIKLHKKAGRKIILVSNAIDVLVKNIADFVGADDYIASKLEIKDNVYTGEVIGSLVYGEKKCDFVRQYLNTHKNLSFADSWGYADHKTDEKFLSAVKYPYAVNPDNGLKKVAVSRKWPILQFSTLL